ncbi:MAG: GGDEF domain-containing protein [Deltaproteobacteria bacterium]|nr:GGDEF domain-containing protein [Deltaproteobacteria bacterium]
MPEHVEPTDCENRQTLQAEIARLNKIIHALMNRAERNASILGSDFNLFHTAITLEDQVRQRTVELEEARLETEKITRALRERENNYRLLLENSPVSIHEIDMDGRIISMSQAGILMHRFTEEGNVQGSLYLDGVSDADRERIGELLAKAYAGETSHFEFKANGPREPIFKSSFVPIKNKNGSVERLMGITEDITERKKAEEYIRTFAFYDALTQLPNRRLLNDRLRQAMSACKRSGRYGAVMFLDLDNFKPLNDAHGHDVGDLLLIEVSHRIARCVREMDTVARFGGDEFVVLLSELDADKERSIALVGIVAERIRVTLAEPYLLTPKREDSVAATTVEHHCTSSIGVVLFINHESSQEDIIKWADTAMYQAKEGGRNMIRFFDRQS